MAGLGFRVQGRRQFPQPMLEHVWDERFPRLGGDRSRIFDDGGIDVISRCR